MKLKLLSFIHHPEFNGKIFDCITNDRNEAQFVDHATGLFYFARPGEFEIIEEEPKVEKSNLVELIGGKPSRIEVEF